MINKIIKKEKAEGEVDHPPINIIHIHHNQIYSIYIHIYHRTTFIHYH
jgi:hypothetical protein